MILRSSIQRVGNGSFGVFDVCQLFGSFCKRIVSPSFDVLHVLFQKIVKCRGTAKIPRVSLFSEVFNKDLVGFFSRADSLVLADPASSLGHGLQKDPRFSDVGCLTGARTLARTHASVLKLFAGIVERESLKAAKRQTNARSPTGDTPSAKRPNTSSGDGQKSTSKSRRSLSLGGQIQMLANVDGQSVLGVTPISDQIDSSVNIDG